MVLVFIGNRPYSITYMISYTLSNNHHTEKFLNAKFVYLPKLFSKVGKRYPTEITNIELDEKFNRMII